LLRVFEDQFLIFYAFLLKKYLLEDVAVEEVVAFDHGCKKQQDVADVQLVMA